MEQPLQHATTEPASKYLAQLLQVFCLFFVVGWLGLKYTSMEGSGVAMIWLPAGVSLLACIRYGERIWPAVFLASGLANGYGLYDSNPDDSLFNIIMAATLIGAVNAAVQTIFAYRLYQKWIGPEGLNSSKSIFHLLLTVAFTASAANMILLYAIWGGFGYLSFNSTTELLSSWFAGVLSDVHGYFAIAPLFIALWAKQDDTLPISSKVLLSLVAVLGIFTLLGLSIFVHPDTIYLLIPLGVLAALYLGLYGAALFVFILSITTTVMTSQGLGPFVSETMWHAFSSLMLFILSTSVPVLVIAVEYLHRTRATRQLLEKELLASRAEQRIEKELLTNRADELDALVKKRTAALSAAKQNAETANLAKTRFLAMMSHEIRTPMNGVLGMAEMLKEADLEPKYRNYLETLEQAGTSLTKVLDDILNFSKLGENKLKFDKAPFKLKHWLECCVLPYKLKTEQGNIKFKLELDEDMPEHLSSDSFRLLQVVNNLINNAFKFTQQGHIILRIRLGAKTASHCTLLFEIEDTGIGINEEAQQRIFKPFEQERDSTSRRFGGTGLGLSICKQLTEYAGGKIWLASTEGKGSTFSFEWPVDIVDGPEEPAETTFDASSLHNINVLLVEDNLINTKVAMALLKRLGISPTHAVNGQEAVDIIRAKKRFDIILMDCEMPVMDGYEATRAIRKWEEEQQQPRHPICAVTAHAMDNFIDECKSAGMDDHISKPLKLEQLQNIIQHLIKISSYN